MVAFELSLVWLFIMFVLNFSKITTMKTYERSTGRVVKSESWNDGFRSIGVLAEQPIRTFGWMLFMYVALALVVLACLGGLDLYLMIKGHPPVRFDGFVADDWRLPLMRLAA